MMDIHRSYFYYESVKDDSAVEEAIRKASEYGDGFWKKGKATVEIPIQTVMAITGLSRGSSWQRGVSSPGS